MFLSGHALRFYERFNRNDAEADRLRGKEDGADGYPSSGDRDFTGHQLRIINKTESDISSYLVELDEQIAENDARRTERQVRRDAYASASSGLLKERENAESQLNDSVGPGSATYSRTKKALDKTDEQLAAVRRADGERPLQAYMSRKLYFATFFLLFLAEMPINIPAIRVIFRDNWLSAGMIAASLSLVMVYFSHSLGRLLRQPGIFKGGRWLYAVLLLSVIALSVGVVLSVYMLRQHYIGSTNLGLTNQTAIEAGWLFLFVNTSVFCAGALVAVFHHDPNPDYQRLTYQQHDAAKTMARLERHYNAAASAMRADFDERERRLSLDVNQLELDIKELDREATRLRETRRGKIELALAVMGERLASYQEGNVASRSPGSAPPIFGATGVDLVKVALRKKFGI